LSLTAVFTFFYVDIVVSFLPLFYVLRLCCHILAK